MKNQDRQNFSTDKSLCDKVLGPFFIFFLIFIYLYYNVRETIRVSTKTFNSRQQDLIDRHSTVVVDLRWTMVSATAGPTWNLETRTNEASANRAVFLSAWLCHRQSP